jgi:hypothetical protein
MARPGQPCKSTGVPYSSAILLGRRFCGALLHLTYGVSEFWKRCFRFCAASKYEKGRNLAAPARHSTDSARLTAYYFFTLRFIHTGRGGSFPRVESEATPNTAQPKRRHNAAAAIAIMTKSGPCMAAHSTTKNKGQRDSFGQYLWKQLRWDGVPEAKNFVDGWNAQYPCWPEPGRMAINELLKREQRVRSGS